MSLDFYQNIFIKNFTKKSPLEVRLSNPDYVLRVDADANNRSKQSAHWYLWYKGKPIARITTYGVWTSWPPVSRKIRLEAEALTWRYFLLITSACGQSPENDMSVLRRYTHYYTEWAHEAPT